jgi:hypothetical protein
MDSPTLTLIGTEYCHLCDDAAQMINKAINHSSHALQSISYHKLDIMNDNNMFQKYSLQIPVILMSQNNRHLELKWPFDQKDIESKLHDFLNNR